MLKEKKFYTVSEVADLLRLNHNTVCAGSTRELCVDINRVDNGGSQR